MVATDSIHYINTKNNGMPVTNCYSPRYYMKRQTPCCVPFTAQTIPIYVQIPGAVLSFYHPTPMLYEITFHAHCQIKTAHTVLRLRLRVDGHLIILDGLSSDMASDDGTDGVYMVSNDQTAYMMFQCFKTDWIYLAPGVHIIDAVALTTNSSQIDGGALKIKLTQIDNGTDINMPIVTPPRINFV